MKYKLKMVRVYELEFETDGYRILADGLWARGLRKEALQPFCWEKDVAPSRELQNWFGYNPKRFLIFRELYVKELDTNPYADAFRQRIEEVLNTKDILLLFAAKDRDMCFCLFWVFNDWAVSGTFFNLKNLF